MALFGGINIYRTFRIVRKERKMADIAQYLQDILDAVYGEQVRGSIHDAIEIINEASEVCISAGTAVTSASSSSTGFFEDSLYLNTNTCDLWKCTGVNTWTNVGNLRGISISNISKTGTSGNVDTYTITFDDGSTSTFTVTNGIDGTDGTDGVDGSVWYKGTALTGTGSSITGFPGAVNDFYLNSSTGMVYVCTKTGGALLPDAAEWDYVMTLTGGGGGGGSIVVIDNLTSGSSTDALSANQGRVLKAIADNKVDADLIAEVAMTGDYDDLINKPITWVTESQTVGNTSVVSNDDVYTTSSKIILLADNGTGKPVKYSSVTLGTGTCTITFPALTANTDFAIGVFR